MGKFKKLVTKTEDDLFRSLNHNKNVKYRIRVQEEEEAKRLIKEELLRMSVEKPPKYEDI